MSATDPVELLSRVPLFSELSRTSWSGSRRSRFRARFPPGCASSTRAITRDACYLVRSGDLRVTREHSDGRAIALATLGPGDIFGELAMFDGEARSASVETLSDSELLALPAADFRRLLADHPEIAVKLIARPDPAPSGDQRAGRPAVVPDRPEPGRRACSTQLIAEEAVARGAPGRDDPDDPGGPGPARGHLARERQPLPGHARARRRGPGGARPGHGGRAPAPARLHLLMRPRSEGARVRRAARRDGRAPAAPARDRRRAGAGGDGEGAPRALRAGALPPARLRRLGAADRRRADDLPALDRGCDLPGAGAARGRSGCSRSGPAPATRRRCWRGWRAR